MIAENEVENFENFKDCLSNTVIQKLAPNGGKPVKKIKGKKKRDQTCHESSGKQWRKQ